MSAATSETGGNPHRSCDAPPPLKKQKTGIGSTESMKPTTTKSNDPSANDSESKSSDFKPVPWNTKSRGNKQFQLISPLFEKYYQRQGIIKDPKEWDLFLKTLRRELPTSFRFNPGHKLHGVYKERMVNDYYNLQKLRAF